MTTAKAEQIRADKSKEQVDELYENKYKNALTVEPVVVERVVTKRLYIKADCDVQADVLDKWITDKPKESLDLERKLTEALSK